MDIEQLLENYTPTGLEKELQSACPFFKEAENTFSSVYLPVHDLANNLLAVKLQHRLNGIKVETEQELEGTNGRVDIRVCASNGKIDVRGSRKRLVTIELKTGAFRLVQPLIYSLKEEADVLIAGLQNAEVQWVPHKLAESLLQTISEHLDTKERLRKEGSYIRGTCKRCANSECGYAQGEGLKLNERTDIYENKMKLLNGNLDTLASKIEEYIREKLEKNLDKQKVPLKSYNG